jgi:hypothetical protein
MRQSGAVIEAMDSAISARLTEEQREKFVVLKEAQRARMKVIMEERLRRRAEGEREREREREPGRMPPGGPPADAP